MFHPDSEMRTVSSDVGVGVFATSFIPAGTIMYFEDKLDIKISPDDPLYHDARYRVLIHKYAYTDANGIWTLSWDNAKYVNHCCYSNTISTGFGFDIALRDIAAGEEITDQYGLYCFLEEEEMDLSCHYSNDCRKRLRVDDIERYCEQWDAQIERALQQLPLVNQPLMQYLDAEIDHDLANYFKTGEGYPTVCSLKL